jgi:hypothetical protein
MRIASACVPAWTTVRWILHDLRQCGSKLRVIAFITDSLSIKQVLEPLGLWSDENQRPRVDLAGGPARLV